MWTLRHLIKYVGSNSTEINGEWVPSRPINWTCRTIKERFIEAWSVFSGKAEPFTWPEGQ